MLGDPTWGGVRGVRLAPTTCACARAATACSWLFGMEFERGRRRLHIGEPTSGGWLAASWAPHCYRLLSTLGCSSEFSEPSDINTRASAKTRRRSIAVPAFSSSAPPSKAWASGMRTYGTYQSIPSTKCQRVWINRDNFITCRIIQYIRNKQENHRTLGVA